MDKLLWNEGMSVGIEAIDNDHKQIIHIINTIATAIDNESTEDIINEIFSDLEHYTSSHFAREEQLLREINYAEYTQHKKLHQQFVDKIPELKAKLLRKESVEVAEKINSFLHSWITHHILVEDMNFAQPAHIYHESLKSTTSVSILNQFSNWLNSHLKLLLRFGMITILPIIGMLMLSFIILNENYQQYKNMLLLSGMNTIIQQANSLSHHLQSERGLSSGYISSDTQRFLQQLTKSRQSTDQSIQSFFSESSNLSLLLDNPTTQLYIQKLKEKLSKLKEQRDSIDHNKITHIQSHQFYTGLIHHILLIDNALIHFDMDSKLANNIIAINSILNIKEVMGQERALGVMLIEKGLHNPKLSHEITILQGKKITLLQLFQNTADNKQKSICGSICSQSLNTELSGQLTSTFTSDNKIALSSQQWFKTMSDKINQLKSVTEQLIEELDIQTDLTLNHLLNKFYLVLFILGSISLLSILSSIVLSHSIIQPIYRITHVLKEITIGNKSLQVYEKFKNDEIGNMFDAYEKLRRKLLQADIAEDFIYDQEKYLQFRRHENAHYKELASIDPLTGALNRRKFDEIIEEEILISNNNQRDFSIMLLDIDHFKKINDTYGHATGDQVLQLFYQLCYKTVRFSDIVTRVGGEEFVILMPATNLHQARRFAERIRATVNDTSLTVANHNIHITVSIGVTQWNSEHFESSDELLDFSDQGLYEAKNSGRNKVVAKSK